MFQPGVGTEPDAPHPGGHPWPAHIQGWEVEEVVSQNSCVLLLLEHRSNSPSLKATQEEDSLFCKAMRAGEAAAQVSGI